MLKKLHDEREMMLINSRLGNDGSSYAVRKMYLLFFAKYIYIQFIWLEFSVQTISVIEFYMYFMKYTHMLEFFNNNIKLGMIIDNGVLIDARYIH